MTWDRTDGEDGTRRGGGASGPDLSREAVSKTAGAQAPSDRVKAAAGKPASQVEPTPRPKARARAKPRAEPEGRSQKGKQARTAPRFDGVKRLRRDECFYICAPECTTRQSLIQTFAEAFRFPMGWTLDWASFEQHMTDLRWLMSPWPPRRACFLTVIDADYLLVQEPAELVQFMRALEVARRTSALPFDWEGLVKTPHAMRRLIAAEEEAMAGL